MSSPKEKKIYIVAFHHPKLHLLGMHKGSSRSTAQKAPGRALLQAQFGIYPPCSVGASSSCTFAICGSACSHAKQQQAFGIRLHRLLQANSPLLLKASLTIMAERPGPKLTAANPPRCCLCRQPRPSPAGRTQPRCHVGNSPTNFCRQFLGGRAVTQRGNAGVGQAAVPCRERPLPLLVSAVIHDSRHAQCVISHEYLPVSAICHDL